MYHSVLYMPEMCQERSSIIEKADRDRVRKLHADRLSAMGPTVDTAAPESLRRSCNRGNAKQAKLARERRDEITRDNRTLLANLGAIGQRESPYQLPEVYRKTRKHRAAGARRREKKKIHKENMDLIRRMVKAHYDAGSTTPFAVRSPRKSPRTEEDVDLKPVRAKLKAAAYTAGGADWEALFRRTDASGDGTLGPDEFKKLVRRTLKLPPGTLSDQHIELVFARLDADGSGEMAPDELRAFVEAETTTPMKTKRPEKPAPPRTPHSENKRRSPRVLAHAPPARLKSEEKELVLHRAGLKYAGEYALATVARLANSRTLRVQLYFPETVRRHACDLEVEAAATWMHLEPRVLLAISSKAGAEASKHDEERRAAKCWDRLVRGFRVEGPALVLGPPIGLIEAAPAPAPMSPSVAAASEARDRAAVAVASSVAAEAS